MYIPIDIKHVHTVRIFSIHMFQHYTVLSQNLHFLFNCRANTLTQRLFNYIDDNALINQLSESLEVGQHSQKILNASYF
jgi:hypothetical protein